MKKMLIAIITIACSNSFAYYQAQQGRWMSRDPIQENGGKNIYIMLYNNTVNDIDILGLYSAYTGDPFDGRPANRTKIIAARSKLRTAIQRLKNEKHKGTDIPCFNVIIKDDPNGGRLNFAQIANAPKSDYSFITAHGSERHYIDYGSHTRMFYEYGNGIFPDKIYMNDSSFESLAKLHGNTCTVYGCYSTRDNPNDTADLAEDLLLHLREDLENLKCSDDCKTETVTIIFSYLGG